MRKRQRVAAFGPDEAHTSVTDPPVPPAEPNLLLPVLPLRDRCLFPEASLELVLTSPDATEAVELASRAGRRLLAVAQKDPSSQGLDSRELHAIGTLAELAEDMALPGGGHRVELDGVQRARIVTLIGSDPTIGEVELLAEGDPGNEWGATVEALARYLHSHPDLRAFLDQQRRSGGPMSWVNLACQHLPITATARQKLLDSDAAERCLRISRGLDALLRKEQGS